MSRPPREPLLHTIGSRIHCRQCQQLVIHCPTCGQQHGWKWTESRTDLEEFLQGDAVLVSSRVCSCGVELELITWPELEEPDPRVLSDPLPDPDRQLLERIWQQPAQRQYGPPPPERRKLSSWTEKPWGSARVRPVLVARIYRRIYYRDPECSPQGFRYSWAELEAIGAFLAARGVA